MRKLPALVLAGILLGACSPGETADTTTTAPGTTTTAKTTTTPVPATTTAAPTTTVPPTTTTSVVDALAPQGSGCTPGTTELPDGVWYGFVADFDDEGISFDLACWFSGDGAIFAAAEDGEESPPPNDYYVRNENQQLRELMVEADTPVLWYLSGDPNDSQQGTFSEWVDFLDTQDFRLGVWVTITDGKVSGIEEQWVP